MQKTVTSRPRLSSDSISDPYLSKLSHRIKHFFDLKVPSAQPIGSVNMVFRRRKRKKPVFSVRKWDPLFIIFEKHLYDFNYESRDLFLKSVVEEYLAHLVQQKAVVPPAWRSHLEKTIHEEVADMLVRKLYGCLTVEEFKAKAEEKKEEIITQKREVRRRYQKLVS